MQDLSILSLCDRLLNWAVSKMFMAACEKVHPAMSPLAKCTNRFSPREMELWVALMKATIKYLYVKSCSMPSLLAIFDLIPNSQQGNFEYPRCSLGVYVCDLGWSETRLSLKDGHISR